MKRFFVLIGVLILSSCSAEQEISSDNALKHTAAPGALSARLYLRVLEEKQNGAVVGIVIKNPTRFPFQSVRSWVQFDPVSARVRNLGIADTRFALFAPGERTADHGKGLIKLGAASRSTITDDEILFATFAVEFVGNQMPTLSFYDWREDGDGHTAVLSLSEDAVVNIVQFPSSLQL